MTAPPEQRLRAPDGLVHVRERKNAYSHQIWAKCEWDVENGQNDGWWSGGELVYTEDGLTCLRCMGLQSR